jgi:hypothetical protein
MTTDWQKSQKMENQIFSDRLDDLQNVDAKIGYQDHKRRGTLNEIQHMEKKKRKESCSQRMNERVSPIKVVPLFGSYRLRFEPRNLFSASSDCFLLAQLLSSREGKNIFV